MTTKFKHKLKELGLSVDEVCNRLNVSKQMIYYWREYGIRSWLTAGKVADKLHCDPDEIIGVINDRRKENKENL